MVKFFLYLLAFICVRTAFAESLPSIAVKGIPEIPHLSADLPVGTLAWALPDELHAGQPQTGEREVQRKIKDFSDFLKEDSKDDFSKDLLKFALAHESISPVFLVDTPKFDSRYGHLPFVAYVTDRTHGSAAQSRLYKKVYGGGLKKVILSKDGLPMNWILVKVAGNLMGKSFDEVKNFLTQNKHVYLEKWSRADNGDTVIEALPFEELPERPYDTTDNPYRSVIGELQHQDKIPRVATDFSQFMMAKPLVENKIISWDKISVSASDDDFDKSLKKADKYFDIEAGKRFLEGMAPSEQPISCKALF